MIKRLFFLFVGVGIVSGQTWISRARVQNFDQFYRDLMQETIYELERRQWCNLKLDDYTHALNEQLYNWHVGGSVTYTNGFVVSIQKLDFTNIQQIMSNWFINNEQIPHATVRGNLNMHHVQVGFDVIANITTADGYEIQRSTGSFTHNAIQLQLSLTKNIMTDEISAASTLLSLSAGDRMVYLPANNVTEVLSRRYVASSNFDSVGRWGREIINPIMLDLVKDKFPFPTVCFSC